MLGLSTSTSPNRTSGSFLRAFHWYRILTFGPCREVFEPFGDLEFVNLHIDPETGRSKGFAFVQYQSPEDAKKALQHCNGLELAGRQLKVGLVTEAKTDMGLGAGGLDDEGTGIPSMLSLLTQVQGMSLEGWS
jgi:hypothetical protein